MGARCHASARWITPTPRTRLTVLVGEAVDVLDSIHQDHGVATIRAHEETGVGWSYGRDLGVASWSKQHGIRFEEYPTNGVIRGLIDRDHWSPLRDARIRMPLLDPPDRIVGIDLGTDIPTVSELGLTARPLTHRPEPGELAALNTARSFLEVRGEPYRWAMSGPSVPPSMPLGWATSVHRKREHPTTRSDGGRIGSGAEVTIGIG